MKWSDLITDNEGDLELVSVMAAVSCAVLLSLTVYLVVWGGSDFHMTDFGIAVAAILGTGGVGYNFKANAYSKFRRDRDMDRGNRRTEDLDEQ